MSIATKRKAPKRASARLNSGRENGSKRAKYRLAVVIERDGDGFFAKCPSLPGCVTQGDTYEETLAHAEDAIRLYIEDLLADGQFVPTSEGVSFTTLEVTA